MPFNQSEFDSLTGKKSATTDRRNFIKATVGAGFATAVSPICAQSLVKTDTEGLDAGYFKLDIDGTPIPVYKAQPKEKDNLPIVIVISEIFGLHEHIADVARRFAKQGYLALAPNLFIRQGNPGSYDSVATLMKDLVANVPDSQVIADLDACVAWAKKNGGNPDKIAITGFCWGGRMVWLYSAHNPDVKAGVAWYGRLVGGKEPAPLQPKNPIDIATQLKTPVLGLYGGKDTGIAQESVKQMKEALAKGNSHTEIIVYPDAGHAFHADYRPSYVASDAKDSWERCIAWLHKHDIK